MAKRGGYRLLFSFPLAPLPKARKRRCLLGAAMVLADPPLAEGLPTPTSSPTSQQVLRAACLEEITATLLAALRTRSHCNISRLKQELAAKYGLSTIPKLRELIAALPEEFRDRLTPFLRTKPVRSASGVAVVAVMCKPHRCPHLAFTGGVCVYCA